MLQSVSIYIFSLNELRGFEYDLKFKEGEMSPLHTSQIYTFCEQIFNLEEYISF